MKKRRGVIGYLVLIMFVATLVACASTAKQSSTGEYVDDSVIIQNQKIIDHRSVPRDRLGTHAGGRRD